MCWSERASYFSFVVGTLTNAIVIRHLIRTGDTYEVPMLLSWQFGLMMQIPEAMEWRDMRLGRKRNAPGNIAFLLNILQPAATYVATSVTVGTFRHYPATIGLVVYALLFLTGDINRDIRPTKDCPHINLDWWPSHRGLYYHVVMIVLLSRLRSFWIHALVFEGTWLFSRLKKPCAVASVWCWTTFVAAVCVFFLRHRTFLQRVQE